MVSKEKKRETSEGNAGGGDGGVKPSNKATKWVGELKTVIWSQLCSLQTNERRTDTVIQPNCLKSPHQTSFQLQRIRYTKLPKDFCASKAQISPQHAL